MKKWKFLIIALVVLIGFGWFVTTTFGKIVASILAILYAADFAWTAYKIYLDGQKDD